MKLETLANINAIKQLKIFQGINEAIVEMIIRNTEREHFKVGEIIMEQGEEPNGKGYIIEAGSVDVWVNGTQTAKLSVGEIFGEVSLLNEEERTATIVAQTPVTTMILSQEILFKMIESGDNAINKEVIRRMEENLENE